LFATYTGKNLDGNGVGAGDWSALYAGLDKFLYRKAFFAEHGLDSMDALDRLGGCSAVKHSRF
jgi:hypothetical protein